MSNLIEALGFKDIEIGTDHFQARIELTEFHAQPQGFVNGGAILAAAEIAAGYASIQLISPDKFPVGQTFMANHMQSKICEGSLFLRGELLHQGRKTHVWCVRFYDELDNLISQVNCTNAIVNKNK